MSDYSIYVADSKMSKFETLFRKFRREEGSTFDDLDPMVMGEIISRLPLKELLSCMTLSRTIYLHAHDECFVKLHLSRSRHIILIEPVVKKSRSTMPPPKQLSFLDIAGGEVHLMHLPEDVIPLSSFRVMATSRGILCIKDSSMKVDPLFLLNPLRREHVKLPSSGSKKLYSSCLLSMGWDDEIQRHKILRLYRFERGHKESKIEILTVGDSSWRELPMPFEMDWHAIKMTFFNGVFYVQFTKKDADVKWWLLHIVAIDSRSEQLTVFFFPKLFSSRPSVDMVELNGKLSFVGQETASMVMWKLCGDKSAVLQMQPECLLKIGYKCSKRFSYKILRKVEEHKYLLCTTVRKTQDNIITEFDLTGPFPEYKKLEIDGLPDQFNTFVVQPSYLPPVVPLLDG